MLSKDPYTIHSSWNKQQHVCKNKFAHIFHEVPVMKVTGIAWINFIFWLGISINWETSGNGKHYKMKKRTHFRILRNSRRTEENNGGLAKSYFAKAEFFLRSETSNPLASPFKNANTCDLKIVPRPDHCKSISTKLPPRQGICPAHLWGCHHNTDPNNSCGSAQPQCRVSWPSSHRSDHCCLGQLALKCHLISWDHRLGASIATKSGPDL